MAGNAVIVDPQHNGDWIVPRRVMCAFFWVGIILLFTGIILLVTSKHKKEFYQSWGAILLGLGFCLLLICFILCLHAYCVITVSDDEVPNARRTTPQQTPTTRSQPGTRQKAPLKHPPNFKIASSEAGSPQSTLDRRRRFNPGRLTTITENGSPRGSKRDLLANNYGSTGGRADHVRTCASPLTSRPPTGKNIIPSRDNKTVHYTASPSSVTIALGDSSSNQDTESGYQNSTGTDNGSVMFSLSCEDERDAKGASSKSSSSLHTLDEDSASTVTDETVRAVPMALLRYKDTTKLSTPIHSAKHSPTFTSQAVTNDTPDNLAFHRSLSSPKHANQPESDIMFGQSHGQSGLFGRNRTKSTSHDCDVKRDPFSMDLDLSQERPSERHRGPVGRAARYAGMSAVDEEEITPEYQTPVHTDIARVQETVAYSRPIASARVTQLPSNRQPMLPNGSPPQLTYSRQYPISSVQAYPARMRRHSPYTPLSVQVDSPNDQNDELQKKAGFRPLPAISEQHSAGARGDVHHSTAKHVSLPRDQDVIRPFDRAPTNLLGVQSGNLMGRVLTNSANVYLNPDQELNDSKMSIYDNLNYIQL